MGGDDRDTWGADSAPGGASGWEGHLDEHDGGHPFAAADPDRYEERGLLGEGGMGQVHTVRDLRLRRDVALKRVRVGLGSDAEARLAREAWITAQLEHPGIVPVHDAGVTEDGHLYYTMRLIRGASLESLLAEAGDQGARLKLLRPFLDACHAVAYAHSVGVVHRDLKPANILIGEFGETQVVDWGLARPVRADGWGSAVLDRVDLTAQTSGSVTGTPAYMSPEQAVGEPADERSDVWGLGVILHELLAGRPPFVGESGREVLRQVRTAAPEPLEGEAPRELVAIVDRALQRDPARRYPDGKALADDVLAYLDGRHVQAYAYTPVDHLQRFVEAWRVPIALVCVGVLALSVLGATAAKRTADERDRARAAEERTAEALVSADRSLAQALVQQARTRAAEGDRPDAEVLAAHALALGESPEARGVLARFGGPRPELVSEVPHELPCQSHNYEILSDGRRLVCNEHDAVSVWTLEPLQRVWSKPLEGLFAIPLEAREEVVLLGMGDPTLGVVLRLEDGSVARELAVPDGTVAVASADGEHLMFPKSGSTVISTRDGAFAATPRVCARGEVAAAGTPFDDGFLAACTDGTLVALTSGGVERWELALGSMEMRQVDRIVLLDEARALFITHRGTIALVDRATWTELHVTESGLGEFEDISVSPDGRLVALGATVGEARLWHAETGRWVGRLPTGDIHEVHFDGDELLVLSDDIQRWSLPELRPESWASSGGFTGVAFSPDGRHLCGATGDGRILAWGIPGFEVMLDEVLATDNVAKDCAFSSDGRFVHAASIGTPGAARFHTTDWSSAEPLLPATDRFPFLRRVAALDGLVLGLAYVGAGPELWRSDGTTIDAIRLPGITFTEAEANHAGTAATLLDRYGDVFVLRVAGAPSLEKLVERDGVVATAITDDGERLFVADALGVHMLSARDGTFLETLLTSETPVRELAVSPGDRYVAMGNLDGSTTLWDLEAGQAVAVLRGHHEIVATLAFSPDGRWLASGSWDGSARIWGLDDLHTPASELVAARQADWKLDLDEALAD